MPSTASARVSSASPTVVAEDCPISCLMPMRRCATCPSLTSSIRRGVAVFGQSMGGETALHAIDRDLAAQFSPGRFRAAIAYYPYCDIPAATMTAPSLILIGEDETNPVEQCREMVA